MNIEISIGEGFLDVIQLLLIVLKFCGVVTWSWAVVLIPFWIGCGLAVVGLIVAIVVLFRNKRK